MRAALVAIVAALVLVVGCADSQRTQTEVAVGAQSQPTPVVTGQPSGTPVPERLPPSEDPPTRPTPSIDVATVRSLSAPIVTQVTRSGDELYCLASEPNADELNDPVRFLQVLSQSVSYWLEIDIKDIQPDRAEYALDGDLVVGSGEMWVGGPDIVRLGAIYGSVVDAGFDRALVPVRMIETAAGTNAVSLGALVPYTSGTWQFVLPCHSRQIESIYDVFLATSGADRATFYSQVLEALGYTGKDSLARPDQGRLESLYPPVAATSEGTEPEVPAWNELSPRSRNLLDAPPELQARLENRLLLLDIPPSWYGTGAVLCTRTTSGWNPCFELNEPPKDIDEAIPMEILRLPGESVEFTFSTGGSAIDTTAATITTIPSKALDGQSVFEVAFSETLDHPTDLLSNQPGNIRITPKTDS